MQENREIRITSMEYPQLDKAFQLIWKVFQEYVAPDYTEEGIKTFYEQFVVVEKLRESGVKKIKLNASPYAVPFYHYLGFCDTGEQTSYKGIVYTPMEKVLT